MSTPDTGVRFCCIWCHDEMDMKFHKTHTAICMNVMNHAKTLVRELMYSVFGMSEEEAEDG